MSSSQSNQKIDLAQALVHLKSHRISSLFRALGWVQPSQRPITLGQQRCTLIAQSPVADDKTSRSVWQVELRPETALTPDLERRIYQEIAALDVRSHSQDNQAASPLAVFVDETKTRSLWRANAEDSALYIAGQPVELWAFRLRRLSQYPHRLLLDEVYALEVEDIDAEYETFIQLLESLHDEISGIGDHADRDRYAMLTLQRLILLQSMQRKGWLNKDVWYLQNRFGKAPQAGKDIFFSEHLQPLYRSLALPEIERPLALVEQIGIVPFLERVFDQHPLEEKYEAIAITDQPFENILGWLSEQSNSDALNPFASSKLSHWMMRYWAARSQSSTPEDSTAQEASKTVKILCSRSLDTYLKQQILKESRSRILSSQQFKAASLNNLLFNANTNVCRFLIQEVLPELRILDPACGSGRLLLVINQRLVEVFAILTGYIQQTQDAQLKIWQSGLESEFSSMGQPTLSASALSTAAQSEIAQSETHRLDAQPNLLLQLQKRVLKNNIYGTDILKGATETARFQLLLATLAVSNSSHELNPIPDLSFSIFTGNSLVGFVQVDEKRFDQVNTSGESSVLQGNLLQPLAADGYKTTLAEKNLAIEHYKSRNQVLAAASIIPAYARASLLKEEIAQLDNKAQTKLNTLLLNYMSEQLGIQYKAMQLADKPQRRLLSAEDVDVLQPFHWGYHFNTIIRRGGFDVVVCVPPQGAFKPTTEEFVQRFRDIAIAKSLSAQSLKTSKQALSKADPDVARAWMSYQDIYAYTADYFYRSEQYAHQNPMSKGKLVRNQLMRERLFTERCLALLTEGGIGAIALRHKLSEDKKAQTLWQYLQNSSDCAESDCSELDYAEQSEKTTEPNDIGILNIYKRSSI